MKLALYAAPATEPLTLAEAKAHLRVDSTAENDLITALIVAARQSGETRLRRALVTQTWDLKLDAFPLPCPGRGWPAPGWDRIDLPLAPLVSVSSITYVDLGGTTRTLATSDYVVFTGTPGRVSPVYLGRWPAVQLRAEVVAIRFVAGYGAAAAVPACVKQAILLLIGHWFEQREAVAVNVGANIMVMPEAVDALLAPEAWGSYA